MKKLKFNSTLNHKQSDYKTREIIVEKVMAYRCPHSRVVGTSEIKDFELEFRGVATIVPNKGATVPVSMKQNNSLKTTSTASCVSRSPTDCPQDFAKFKRLRFLVWYVHCARP